MKLQQKIPLYVIAVMLLVGGLGALALLTSQRSTSTHMFEDTSSTLTDTILNGLEQDMLRGDRGHIQTTIDNLNRHENVRSIDILTADGHIWASSNRETVGLLADANSESLLNSNRSQVFYGDSNQDHMTDVAVIPVKDECLSCHGQTATPANLQGNLGAIRVDISTVSLQESLDRSRQILLIIAGLTFILVAGTLVLLLRRTTLVPLKQLTKASARISRADYSARVPVDNLQNELGSVSEAFNEMAATIEEHTGQLENANRELQQASRMKSEFLANMSHELRTPLNVIIGFSEVLRDTPSDKIGDSDRAEFCDNIVSSGHHLLELINDVLDLAKVEAGQMQIFPEEFYVGKVLNEIVSAMSPLARKKDIKLDVELSEHLTVVLADIAKFKQILYNLIGNALKFTPHGGTVHISASVMGKMARFAVADNGIGIAQADQRRIFSEFQQVDGSSSRQFEGTGLGLALTKKFVEMQKGEIWVDSEIGMGSTFYFTLPIPAESVLPNAAPAERKLSIAEAGGAAASGPGPKPEEYVLPLAPRVLVVEDDRKTAELIGLWLGQEGYEVDYAVDGVDALEKVKARRPFAICLDIMLPRKDGWQVLHQLKSDPGTADLNIIICSALDNPELGFALGAADYCMKPLSRRHLLDKLRHLKEVAPARRSQPQILVAEDDLEESRRTAGILERQGFGVIQATDGKQAMALALEQSPDIIIIDFQLPGTGIFDVLTFLRDHPLTVNTPIIVTTGKDISRNDEELLRGSRVEKIIPRGEHGRDHLLGEMFRLEKLNPEQAMLIDRETRMFNRRYFDKRLAEEVKRAQRYSLDLSLLLIGLDRGGRSPAHSERLTALAAILRASIRAADPLARYDTDRFGVLLPETSKEAGRMAARKIVEIVREHQQQDPAQGTLPLTVSVASTGDYGGALTPDQLTTKLEAMLKTLEERGGDAAMFD
ncbi:MAG: response regulator [Thermoleophilia bacterium]